MTRWRAAAPDRLVWRELEGFPIVFDRLSGRTHILSEPLPEILQALADVPLDTDGVLAALAACFDLQADEDARAAIGARIAELAELGLIDAA